MSKGRSSSVRKRKSAARQEARFAFDPYFASLIFAGVGLGTLGVKTSPRLVVLWVTLLALWVVYRERQTVQLQYRLSDIGRGTGIGLAISGPLLLLTFRAMMAAVPILYVSADGVSDTEIGGTTIFVSLVLLAPLAEELFFRDILQKEKGFWIAAALCAVAGVILFLPTAGQFFAVLIAVGGAHAVLGLIYGYLYQRFGLAASMACHVTVNLVLIFVPAVLSHLDLLAQ